MCFRVAASWGCISFSPHFALKKNRLESGNCDSNLVVPGLCNDSERLYDTGKPSDANFTAGSSTSVQDLWPYFLCASSKPRTDPGTPEARQPTRLSLVSLPVASRYISREAL